MTNSDRLQEIRERAEAATKGPWSAHTATRYLKDNDPERGILGPNGENAICWIADEFEDSESNDDFIAEARSDIPYLLQLVTEQQEEAERRNVLLREAGNELLAFKRGMEKLGYWESEEDEAFASLLDQIKAATQ